MSRSWDLKDEVKAGVLSILQDESRGDRRGRWMTDLFEAIMTCFHELADASTLSELQIASDIYPPDNLGICTSGRVSA